jgi:hypothetical protein
MRSRIQTIILSLTIVVAALGFACNTDHDAHSKDSAKTQSSAADESTMSETDALHKADPNGAYGAGLSLEAETELAKLLADPAAYEGQAVRVRGVVEEVCPMRGCWIDLAEASGSENIRIKVTDGEIVFPLSAKNATAVVEGTVERIELDEQENRDWQQHLAEERGETFDPKSVEGPATIWRIVGKGAEISS